MINFLNETLRQLFLTRMKGHVADPSQLSFDFPDDDFRSHVKAHGKSALNVCLVELRENRTAPASVATDVRLTGANGAPNPRRVDCHYLISAWSPATRSVEPTMDEHALLYQTMVALMDCDPLVPAKIYGEESFPRNFPAVLRKAQLPVVVLPVERFPRMAEFWSASRGVHWKPTIHVVITLPILSDSQG